MFVASKYECGLGGRGAFEKFVVRGIADNDFESFCGAHPESVLADFTEQLLPLVLGYVFKSMNDSFILVKDWARQAELIVTSVGKSLDEF